MEELNKAGVPNDINTTKNSIIEDEENAERPGMGQFRCTECDRYFVDAFAMDKHVRSKVHKRRLKLLGEEPYSQKDAERAAGMTH